MKLPSLLYGASVIAGLAVSSTPSVAQRPFGFALDASAGSAFGSGGIYRDRHLDGGARIAMSVRYRRPHTFGFFGEVAGDALDVASDHLTDCPPDPRGGCLRWYPRFLGVSGSVGVIAQPNPETELRAAVGGGSYRASGTAVGAVVGQFDGAVFPFRHLGLVAGVRAVVVPRFRHERLWMIPWMFGARLR